MKWIIIIGDETLTLDTIRGIEHPGNVHCYDDEELPRQYCVAYEQDYISYTYNNEIINDYEEPEREEIPFCNPHFIVMRYRCAERAKSVISHDSFPKNVWIDNDYGLITPVDNFIALGMPMDHEAEAYSLHLESQNACKEQTDTGHFATHAELKAMPQKIYLLGSTDYVLCEAESGITPLNNIYALGDSRKIIWSVSYDENARSREYNAFRDSSEVAL